MKLKIKELYIEEDVVNKSPKLVVVDENDKEWVLETYPGESPPVFTPKENDWYFKQRRQR